MENGINMPILKQGDLLSWSNKLGETFRVGDIVRTYHKGIHKILRIESRGFDNPLVYSRSIMDANFKPKRGSEKCCDAFYLKRVTEQIILQELEEATLKFKQGIKILKENQ